MEKNQWTTHQETSKEAEVEMDRLYIEKAGKQYNQTSAALELTRQRGREVAIETPGEGALRKRWMHLDKMEGPRRICKAPRTMESTK